MLERLEAALDLHLAACEPLVPFEGAQSTAEADLEHAAGTV